MSDESQNDHLIRIPDIVINTTGHVPSMLVNALRDGTELLVPCIIVDLTCTSFANRITMRPVGAPIPFSKNERIIMDRRIQADRHRAERLVDRIRVSQSVESAVDALLKWRDEPR